MIAVVAPEHPNTPRHGGIARYLRDYVPALAARAEVTLVSIEDGMPVEGVPQEILAPCAGPSPFRPPRYSRRIKEILQRLRPDCVEYANWLGLGCRDDGPWAKVVRLSTPVAHGTLRPGLLPRLARPFHHRWELLTVRHADLWISNTEENLRTCRRVYGLNTPAVVIPHGIRLAQSDPHPDAGDVLFVGRFEHRKGVDLLLRAWAALAEEGATQSRSLHLVGRDMPGHSGSYLQDCLSRLGCSPAAIGIVVEGDMNDAELACLRQRCSIAVVPSRYESFGMVALEAFAAGQALVSSDAGGLGEVVSDGETGLLFQAGDAASLADALRRMLADPAAARQMAAAGKRCLQTRFSAERMVDASLDAYQRAQKR